MDVLVDQRDKAKQQAREEASQLQAAAELLALKDNDIINLKVHSVTIG